MKLLTIVGARPQFIKAAIVSRHIEQSKNIKQITVHTGQHYDENMSEIFFREMNIASPEINLMIGSGSHGQQTGRMMEALETVIVREKPQALMVYGDTNSTLAGALAAAKLAIPIIHIEAGLRSFDRKMPEEINRILTDHVADLLFTPTKTADANLLAEGIAADKIINCGDVMFDAALYYGNIAERTSHITELLDLTSKEFILCTIHRAENTDDPVRLRILFDALLRIANEYPVVFPIHPRTKAALKINNIETSGSQRLIVIEPVGYMDMVKLERHASLILTDSGGVQKEAYFHGVNCIVLRDSTEWVELLEMGWTHLCPPTQPEMILDTIYKHLGTKGRSGVPFGKGNSGEIITQILCERLR